MICPKCSYEQPESNECVTGLLQTRSLELVITKIEGIVVIQGVEGRLLNYGSIVITGSGGTKEVFAGIQDPFAFRKAVQEVITA